MGNGNTSVPSAADVSPRRQLALERLRGITEGFSAEEIERLGDAGLRIFSSERLGARGADVAQAGQSLREAAYVGKQADTLAYHHGSIGWALQEMYRGAAVTRRGWNGRGMFLRIQWPAPDSKMTQPYVYMVTADQQRVPWLCSQADLLASDWTVFVTE